MRSSSTSRYITLACLIAFSFPASAQNEWIPVGRIEAGPKNLIVEAERESLCGSPDPVSVYLVPEATANIYSSPRGAIIVDVHMDGRFHARRESVQAGSFDELLTSRQGPAFAGSTIRFEIPHKILPSQPYRLWFGKGVSARVAGVPLRSRGCDGDYNYPYLYISPTPPAA